MNLFAGLYFHALDKGQLGPRIALVHLLDIHRHERLFERTQRCQQMGVGVIVVFADREPIALLERKSFRHAHLDRLGVFVTGLQAHAEGRLGLGQRDLEFQRSLILLVRQAVVPASLNVAIGLQLQSTLERIECFVLDQACPGRQHQPDTGLLSGQIHQEVHVVLPDWMIIQAHDLPVEVDQDID